MSVTTEAFKPDNSWRESSWRHLASRPRQPSITRAGDNERLRWRVVFAMAAFGVLYAVLAGRLVHLGLAANGDDMRTAGAASAVAAARPDIVDENGEILATDIKTASLYAEPRRIVDADEAAEQLSLVFPEFDRDRLRRDLATNAGFLWLKREITPDQRRRVHELGLPGIGFVSENRRFYPGGPTVSHILGAVNVDNQGIAGMEKYIDDSGLADLHQAGFATEHGLEPVKLSIDLRVQHAVRSELETAMGKYTAKAAIGIVLDVKTGEVVGMSSLPDFDPNIPAQALDKDRLNRATVGVYEMGSTFKTFTTAMALDSGLVHLNDTFDASKPLRISGFTIHDFHGKHRALSVPEIFIYSSNIGTAKMALECGIPMQQEFLGKLGLLDELRTELPEAGAPLKPREWTKLSSVTISFGHGISVSPLQTAAAGAALMNGGYYIPPTFLPRDERTAAELSRRVVKPETSADMRKLMRLNVLKGSGRRAAVPGYRVGGKTGTAEKVVNGKYANDKRRNAFLSAFPIDDPRYLVLVVIDEPNPEKPGLPATAGMNAAPTTAAIIRRIAPMLGIKPLLTDPEEDLATTIAAIE
ncbi:cell division protein FtsI (penicillin-binding protein 3) [Rhodopseudomonas julia]|uniref:Cell division protein FtsI (Penicillin-binding protein 3) n=2 Tax=Rhodopseudomonas julia TaxID=200617 RepID=A0ABU0C802_9BRAD|nr:cell division protein FtsI (penicillin-binding protein 3) [Rhodopseudomonas julia]